MGQNIRILGLFNDSEESNPKNYSFNKLRRKILLFPIINFGMNKSLFSLVINVRHTKAKVSIVQKYFQQVL